MINLIYGPKGSGKTKEIISAANNELDVCKGDVVYITDTAEYTRSVNTAIRYVNARELLPENGRISEEALLGFVKGNIASNSDVTEIFVDGIARMLGESADEVRRCAKGLFRRAHAVQMAAAGMLRACHDGRQMGIDEEGGAQ